MTVKTDNVQVGVSVTPTNNFTLNPDGSGGLKISRGNPGATTQDVLVIDSTGKVTLPQNPVDPWVISTPTPVPNSGAFGSVSAVLRIKKIGTTVFYKITIDIANIGTVPTNGLIQIPVPYPAITTTTQDEWEGTGRESKIVGYTLACFIQSGGSSITITQGGSNLANGHRWNATGFYETAS